jgi:hypothetical protein
MNTTGETILTKITDNLTRDHEEENAKKNSSETLAEST